MINGKASIYPEEGYTETMIEEDKYSAINKRIAYHQKELMECLKKRDALIQYYAVNKIRAGMAVDADQQSNKVKNINPFI